MSLSCLRMCHGVIIESSTESITGPYLYSHTRNVGICGSYESTQEDINHETFLNKLVRVPLLGSIGGCTRVVLSIFHTFGHTSMYAVTGKKGHKYHATAGLCHLLRGLIETPPVIGQIFANTFSTGPRSWWMIKMYNPNKPDNFDKLLDKVSIDMLDANGLYIRA